MSSVTQQGALLSSSLGIVPIGKRELLWLVAVPAIVIAVWLIVGDILYLPIAIIAALTLYWSVRSARIWLTLVILGHAVLFGQKTEGVSIFEAAFALFLFGILSLWFLDRLVIKRGSLITASGDFAFLLFVLLASLSVVFALASESKMFLWLREYLVFLGFLLYFPLRDALRDSTGRWWIYGAFFLLALGIAIKNFLQYRTGALVASYLWELVGARQTANEPLFMAGAAIWMVSDRRAIRLLCFVLVSMFSLALVLTFSRGYWVGAFVGGIVLFSFGEKRERRKLAGLVLVVGVSAIGIMLVFFHEIFSALISTVFLRLFSTAGAAQDISLANRLVESAAVWSAIWTSPIMGSGLGAEYTFYSLLRKTTLHTIYVHNAYLYLWFKLGILGLVAFLASYGGKILAGVRLALGHRDHPRRPLLLSAVAILIAMLLISITSPQFYARDSVLIITLCWGTIAGFDRDAPPAPQPR